MCQHLRLVRQARKGSGWTTDELTGGADGPARLATPPTPEVGGLAFDVVVIVVLTVIAYAMRHGGLPTDGLWFDDSWVAAGAIHGHLTNIMTVGSGQPGFTALLMAWHHLGERLAAQPGPPRAGAWARSPPPCSTSRCAASATAASICALLASIAVVAGVDILYSGRVKPYTFDPVLVLCLGVAIPWLARRTWRWPLAIGWVLIALLFGSFSGYVLVATAAAGIILFLHPAGDRLVRGCAVGAQAVGQLVFYVWAQRSTDLTGSRTWSRTAYDAHLHFYANPFRFGSELLTHLARIAWIYPGGSGGWLKVVGAAGGGRADRGLGQERPSQRAPARPLPAAHAGDGAGRARSPASSRSGRTTTTSSRPAVATCCGRSRRWRSVSPRCSSGRATSCGATTSSPGRSTRRSSSSRSSSSSQGYRTPCATPSPARPLPPATSRTTCARPTRCSSPGPSRVRVRGHHQAPGHGAPDPEAPGRLHPRTSPIHACRAPATGARSRRRRKHPQGGGEMPGASSSPPTCVFGEGVAKGLGAMLKAEGYTSTTLTFASGVVVIWQK